MITARPIAGKRGMVELLVDGVVVSEVRCKPGSARISANQIEFTATISCEKEKAKGGKKKEVME